MKEFYIKLTAVNEIRDFVRKVTNIDYEVDLVQGRYVIDAKSIMGIFSLDLMTPVKVVCHTDHPEAFRAQIADYIVEG